MKILVLQHTTWIEMLAHNWNELSGVEIRTLPLPVADWDKDPALKSKIARLIVDLAEIEKPSFILDVNGAGIMAMDKDFSDWTSAKVPVPWVEWWWDDPMNYYGSFAAENCLEKWYEAMLSPNVIHFFWDREIASEYSRWFRRQCFYLPTAAHPKFFSPEAAGYAKNNFPSKDISFLGTFYTCQQDTVLQSLNSELDLIVAERLKNPSKNYLEMFDEKTLPLFSKDLETAMNEPCGCFSAKLQRWRQTASSMTGIKRRNEALEKIHDSGLNAAFYGDNWPEKYKASGQKIYLPTELSALYRATSVNLDFGNGQAFTASNMRIYEIMSSGSLIALDRIPDFDADSSLRNKGYLHYDSIGELKDLCRFYGGNKKAAGEICDNARIYILENHTWLKRLFSIFSTLSEELSK